MPVDLGLFSVTVASPSSELALEHGGIRDTPVEALPCKGTAVASVAKVEGLVASNADMLRPRFYIVESVRAWLVDRLRSEVEVHPRWNLM